MRLRAEVLILCRGGLRRRCGLADCTTAWDAAARVVSTATATGTPVAGSAEIAEREARDGLGLAATEGIATGTDVAGVQGCRHAAQLIYR